MRTDLYTAIHKSQRFHLFRLAERLGRADLSRPESWPPVATEVKKWLVHLEEHAHHEHALIHPLFERWSDCAALLDAEHDALGRAMAELDLTLAAGRWDELYSRFTAFLGIYLTHIAEEERLQAKVLWTHCSDEELLEVMARFRQSRSPEQSERDLELMLPALSFDELTRMYDGMRRTAPVAVWESAWQLACRTLTHEQMRELEARLAPV